MIMFAGSRSEMELICDQVLVDFKIDMPPATKADLCKVIKVNFVPIMEIIQEYDNLFVAGVILSKALKTNVCSGVVFAIIGRRLMGDNNAEA